MTGKSPEKTLLPSLVNNKVVPAEPGRGERVSRRRQRYYGSALYLLAACVLFLTATAGFVVVVTYLFMGASVGNDSGALRSSLSSTAPSTAWTSLTTTPTVTTGDHNTVTTEDQNTVTTGDRNTETTGNGNTETTRDHNTETTVDARTTAADQTTITEVTTAEFGCPRANHTYALSCPPRSWTNHPSRTACRLTLSTGYSSATVQIATADATDTITLQPGEPHVRVMDQKYVTDTGLQDKGIVVTSDEWLYLTVEHIDTYASPPGTLDSSQVVPLPDVDQFPADEFTYYLASYKTPSPGGCAHPGWRSQFYSIAAAHNHTAVRIYDRANNLEHNITLQQYQTFTFVNLNALDSHFDVTGRSVVSDKPVSVISGALCEHNPAHSALFTSIQPRAHRDFIVPNPGHPSRSRYTLRVIASANETSVQVNGADFMLGTAGDFVETAWLQDTTASVRCDPPCSAYLDTKGIPESGTFLASLVPTDGMYSSVHFTTADYDFPHYVAVLVEGGGPHSDLLLDGQPLADGVTWTAHDGFSSTWIAVAKGPHWLRAWSGRRLAAYVYGHSGVQGGGYGHSVWSCV